MDNNNILNKSEDLECISGFSLLISLFESHMDKKQSTFTKQDVKISQKNLQRIMITNYIMDILTFIEKIEIDTMSEDEIDTFINNVFKDTLDLKYKEKDFSGITSLDEKKEVIKQIRNCLAHSHYTFSYDGQNTKVVLNNSKTKINAELDLDDLKKIVENFIIFFKEDTSMYVSHMTEFSTSGYMLNCMLERVFELSSNTSDYKELDLSKITPNKYATLVQSYNYYMSYVFERLKIQRMFSPGKYIQSLENFNSHQLKINGHKGSKNSKDEIHLKSFKLDELNDNSLRQVLSDFYGFFSSMTDEERQKYNVDDVLETLDSFFDGNVSKDELDLSRIMEIYLQTVPRILRVDNYKLNPKPNEMFQNFYTSSEEMTTFVWPDIDNFVYYESNEQIVERETRNLDITTNNTIKYAISYIKKKTGKNSSNILLRSMLTKKNKDELTEEERTLLELIEIENCRFNNLSEKVTRLKEIISNYEEIPNVKEKIDDVEKGLQKLRSNEEGPFLNALKLYENIRNSLMHGNIHVDYSDYYIDGKLHKVVEDDGRINYNNIRYTFQDFDDKTNKTAFLIMNLRGEDLKKIMDIVQEYFKDLERLSLYNKNWDKQFTKENRIGINICDIVKTIAPDVTNSDMIIFSKQIHKQKNSEENEYGQGNDDIK